MTFLPAPGSVDVAEKVWLRQLSGKSWPLRKELGEICEWKVIEDEARGYIRESPLHREVAGADFLKALHSAVQVVFTKVEVSSDLDGVVQACCEERCRIIFHAGNKFGSVIQSALQPEVRDASEGARMWDPAEGTGAQGGAWGDRTWKVLVQPKKVVRFRVIVP